MGSPEESGPPYTLQEMFICIVFAPRREPRVLELNASNPSCDTIPRRKPPTLRRSLYNTIVMEDLHAPSRSLDPYTAPPQHPTHEAYTLNRVEPYVLPEKKKKKRHLGFHKEPLLAFWVDLGMVSLGSTRDVQRWNLKRRA